MSLHDDPTGLVLLARKSKGGEKRGHTYIRRDRTKQHSTPDEAGRTVIAMVWVNRMNDRGVKFQGSSKQEAGWRGQKIPLRIIHVRKPHRPIILCQHRPRNKTAPQPHSALSFCNQPASQLSQGGRVYVYTGMEYRSAGGSKLFFFLLFAFFRCFAFFFILFPFLSLFFCTPHLLHPSLGPIPTNQVSLAGSVRSESRIDRLRVPAATRKA